MTPPPAEAVLVLSRKSLRKRPLNDWTPELRGQLCLVGPSEVVEGIGRKERSFYATLVGVKDYRSWETEMVAEQVGASFGVSRICSSSEDDVYRAAMLRNRLRLPGQSVESAIAFRDKVVMKNHARKAGIRVPEFRAVEGPIDIAAFVKRRGFPVVIKPRRGAGSAGVRILHKWKDVEDFLGAGNLPAAPQIAGQWMIEEFVRGRLHHVDGLADGGRLRFGWPSRYSQGNAEAIDDRVPLASVHLSPSDAETLPLMRFADEVLGALPQSTVPHAIHLEAWIGNDGEPVLCEVAARGGGGGVLEAHEAAFGVHLTRESLRAQAGLPPSLTQVAESPRVSAGWVSFTAGAGAFAPPSEPCPIEGVTIRFRMREGERQLGPAVAGDGAAIAVVTASSADEVNANIDKLIAWWNGGQRWI